MASSSSATSSVSVTVQQWGSTSDGSPCQLYCIAGPRLRLYVSDFGATVQRVQALVQGVFVDVACGFDNVAAYERPSNRYFGATVGRYGNRIAGGRFSFVSHENGCTTMRTAQLAVNNGPNALHGGNVGFNRRMFTAEIVGLQQQSNADCGPMVGVRFSRISEDGEEGYLSAVRVAVTYAIGMAFAATDDLIMRFEVENVGTLPTPVNVINHNYWNLNGTSHNLNCCSSSSDAMATAPTVMNHVLHLPNAPYYTPVDATSIPTGEVRSVGGTPFDFCSAPKPIGRDIGALDDTPQKGYDHNFVIKHGGSLASVFDRTKFYEAMLAQTGGHGGGAAAARGVVVTPPPAGFVGTLTSPVSGVSVAVHTTFPGMQVYTGNFLPKEAGVLEGLGGASIVYRSTVCLEAQYFPDAPNQSHFPSPVVQPGACRVDWQVYRFSML